MCEVMLEPGSQVSERKQDVHTSQFMNVSEVEGKWCKHRIERTTKRLANLLSDHKSRLKIKTERETCG